MGRGELAGEDVHFLSEDDRKHWTKPLRGSSQSERSPFVRGVLFLDGLIARPGYAPLHTPGWARRMCRGVVYDSASPTHAPQGRVQQSATGSYNALEPPFIRDGAESRPALPKLAYEDTKLLLSFGLGEPRRDRNLRLVAISPVSPNR